jgi:hypothetical protein
MNDFLDIYLWHDFMRVVIYWPQITGLTIDRIHPDKYPVIQNGDLLLKYKSSNVLVFSKN